MKPYPTGGTHADQALAERDAALPGLADLLNNDLLSRLLGEQVQITRVRYKPHTSVLVAFRHTRNGRHHYGWAMTRTPEGNAKLRRREQLSNTQGGAIRLLRLDRPGPGALVAVGGFEDDWELAANVEWLRHDGLQRLRAPGSPDNCAGTILRYKPERRLVLMAPSPHGSIVIKAAAHPYDGNRQRDFWRQLNQHGVPVLPFLADAECSAHGISASPAWVDGDLGARDSGPGARRAGAALAALHSISANSSAAAGPQPKLLAQLAATRTMVATLLPAFKEVAALLAAELSSRLQEHTGHRRPVLVHGDFSPDQVLIAGQEVRLIDFDRAGMGVPEMDLGSFAAVEEITTHTPLEQSTGGSKTAQLIEGYLGAGGGVSPNRLQLWTAYGLFIGCVNPFRDRAPDWADDMARHLNRARELIT